ncbi:MAG: hypothetical protein A2214_01935 [Candidatus Harrisonbacteria bacterium RIFOXYA1_FULL_48_8]|uniref:Uncharacterized protein n=2 Tax=Candidatus Harrisoniibacteriota TaxID=1817905 RepID=A0A1G1ZW24_9BACT|nr:MAG: hypothetical protein UY24_C0042G0009 [Parcubacteria group bacterium GW2011_GWA1_48_11b]OGY68918.1 MAG: hypothetical protein A2214_01935 [Candidatus Harrisonbacteria bacterium RIFOXYA1_FULL_48_8]
MGGAEIRERVRGLANKLMELLENNVLEEPQAAAAAMEQARAIRREIESLGFLVSWRVQLRPLTDKKPYVEVTIWEPRKNLTPEQQRVYDEWFFRVNGIKND